MDILTLSGAVLGVTLSIGFIVDAIVNRSLPAVYLWAVNSAYSIYFINEYVSLVIGD